MKSYAILGNCQANAIASTLQICDTFRNSYELQRVTPIHRISEREHADFLREILPRVDLFMYQPISDRYRGGGFGFSKAVSELSPRTIVISYPSIQFYGYHASSRTLPNMPLVNREHCREIFGIAGSELFHYSQLVAAFLGGLPEDEALGRFHGGFPGDVEFVAQRCSNSLAQLRISEQRFKIDAALHDVIAAGFHDEQLFWSPRHPCGRLLAVIAERVLSQLGIEVQADERERMIRRDPLRFPRYPMQDFIRSTLSLEFDPITAFSSKTKTLSLTDMISAYYEIYARIGHRALWSLAHSAFPMLQTLKGEFS